MAAAAAQALTTPAQQRPHVQRGGVVPTMVANATISCDAGDVVEAIPATSRSNGTAAAGA